MYNLQLTPCLSIITSRRTDVNIHVGIHYLNLDNSSSGQPQL